PAGSGSGARSAKAAPEPDWRAAPGDARSFARVDGPQRPLVVAWEQRTDRSHRMLGAAEGDDLGGRSPLTLTQAALDRRRQPLRRRLIRLEHAHEPVTREKTRANPLLPTRSHPRDQHS